MLKIEWTLSDYLAGQKIETRDLPVVRLDELRRWLEGQIVTVGMTGKTMFTNELLLDLLAELTEAQP